MNQDIKNAVDQLWKNLGLPTAPIASADAAPLVRTPVQEQIDRMWEMYCLPAPASVVVEKPAMTEAVAKPAVSKIIGRVATYTCVVETCKREFVPRHPKHDKCVDCARDCFRAKREAERREEEAEKNAAVRPVSDDQLRQQLIGQYRRGELKEVKDFEKKGAQVLLFGIGSDGRRKSFTFFDHDAAQRIKQQQASTKRAVAYAKSPETLRKEKIEAAKLDAKNLRTSADAAAEKSKSLSDAEAAAKLRSDAEDSDEAFDAYCAAEEMALKAWNEADSLADKAREAEQKLANLIAPPSESKKKDNGGKKNGSGKNGQKGRDRHAN